MSRVHDIFSQKRKLDLHGVDVSVNVFYGIKCGPSQRLILTWLLFIQTNGIKCVSVKHFVPPHQGPADRYSIPFFFNANADWPMRVLPTCTDEAHPPRYPAVSYRQSQAAAQGE